MKTEYLTDVKVEDSSFAGLKLIGNDTTNTWYAGSYKFVKSSKFKPIKKEIIELTNKVKKRNTQVKNWEWHHVVETQHMSQFIEWHKVENVEQHHMPTILIHKPEHTFFSRNFNNNDFRELTNIGKGRRLESGNVTTSNQSAEKLKQKAVIKNLKMMYNQMYEGYPTLNKIANNVFEYHLFRLGV